MATRNAKRTFDDAEATDAQLLPRIGADVDDAYNPDMEAAFEQLREDFKAGNSEGTLWVHRVPLDDTSELIANAKNVFLFSAPIQRYSTEEIYNKVQREFMEGLRVTCVRVSATKKGERGVRFNQLVMVERPQRTDDKPQSEAGGGVQLGSIGEIVRAIQDGQQAMLAMLQRSMHPATQPAAGMQPQIDTLRSLAEIMFLLTGGRQPATAATAPPSVIDQLKTLRELRGFVGELAGDAAESGAGGGDGPVAVLKHLSPWARVFGELLANNPQRTLVRRAPAGAAGPVPTVQPAPVTAQAGNPGIAPMTPVFQQPQTADGDPMLAVLRNEFEALTRAAQEGGTPDEVAPVVLQMLPEGTAQEAMFISFLEDENWFSKLCAVYPPAAPYQAWFDKLRAAILAEFETGETIEGAPGNANTNNG